MFYLCSSSKFSQVFELQAHETGFRCNRAASLEKQKDNNPRRRLASNETKKSMERALAECFYCCADCALLLLRSRTTT